MLKRQSIEECESGLASEIDKSLSCLFDKWQKYGCDDRCETKVWSEKRKITQNRDYVLKLGIEQQINAVLKPEIDITNTFRFEECEPVINGRLVPCEAKSWGKWCNEQSLRKEKRGKKLVFSEEIDEKKEKKLRKEIAVYYDDDGKHYVKHGGAFKQVAIVGDDGAAQPLFDKALATKENAPWDQVL